MEARDWPRALALGVPSTVLNIAPLEQLNATYNRPGDSPRFASSPVNQSLFCELSATVRRMNSFEIITSHIQSGLPRLNAIRCIFKIRRRSVENVLARPS